MQNDILVVDVGARGGGCRAAARIDFADDDAAGAHAAQLELRDGLTAGRQAQLLDGAVEERLTVGAVAHRQRVEAVGHAEARLALRIGPRRVAVARLPVGGRHLDPLAAPGGMLPGVAEAHGKPAQHPFVGVCLIEGGTGCKQQAAEQKKK